MAWSEGNLRWQLSFESLNGISCRVDIYKRGYSGSADDLDGADDPFSYDEDNSEDLLNDVIRFRTGYIRVIEESYGDLAALYPTTNTDHYVEFYYGNTLDFVGFMQAQEFENDWAPGPRVLELPVISPLGLAAGTKIPVINPPQWLTIKQMVKMAFDALGGGYTDFYFPQLMPSDQGGNRIVLQVYLNSLAICPFAGKYDKNGPTGTLEGIYEAKTVEDVLTTICTGLGLVLHDVPATPVFQRIDWHGRYKLYNLATGSSYVDPGVTDIASIGEVVGNQNTESAVMPLSKIEINYDGDKSIPGMTFDRCKGYHRPCALDGKTFCVNDPVIADFNGTFSVSDVIDANGMIASGSVCLGAFGSDGLSESIMFRPVGGTGVYICSYTFFEWNGEGMRLKFRHQYGEGIENMNNPTATIPLEDVHHVIGVVIKTSDYYYSQTNGWTPSSGSLVYTKTWDDGSSDLEVGFGSFALENPKPLIVEFYAVTYNFEEWIHCINGVSLEKYESAALAYLNKNSDPNTKVIQGQPSDTDGSVNAGFGIVITTTNRLRFSPDVTGTEWVELSNNLPTYPHLLVAQKRLQIDVKMPLLSPAAFYLNTMSVWGSSGWRGVARTFHPWDDRQRITFHVNPT